MFALQKSKKSSKPNLSKISPIYSTRIINEDIPNEARREGSAQFQMSLSNKLTTTGTQIPKISKEVDNKIFKEVPVKIEYKSSFGIEGEYPMESVVETEKEEILVNSSTGNVERNTKRRGIEEEKRNIENINVDISPSPPEPHHIGSRRAPVNRGHFTTREMEVIIPLPGYQEIPTQREYQTENPRKEPPAPSKAYSLMYPPCGAFTYCRLCEGEDPHPIYNNSGLFIKDGESKVGDVGGGGGGGGGGDKKEESISLVSFYQDGLQGQGGREKGSEDVGLGLGLQVQTSPVQKHHRLSQEKDSDYGDHPPGEISREEKSTSKLKVLGSEGLMQEYWSTPGTLNVNPMRLIEDNSRSMVKEEENLLQRMLQVEHELEVGGGIIMDIRNNNRTSTGGARSHTEMDTHSNKHKHRAAQTHRHKHEKTCPRPLTLEGKDPDNYNYTYNDNYNDNYNYRAPLEDAHNSSLTTEKNVQVSRLDSGADLSHNLHSIIRSNLSLMTKRDGNRNSGNSRNSNRGHNYSTDGRGSKSGRPDRVKTQVTSTEYEYATNNQGIRAKTPKQHSKPHYSQVS